MRLILRLSATVAVIALLALGAVALIPAERVAEAAARQFTALTGRELTISGKVQPRFWPDLAVRTGPVTIANADWSEEGPMLQAESLDIAVNLAALWGGEVRVTGFHAVRPRIVLEQAADGQANWLFGGTQGGTITSSTPGVGAPFTFDQAVLEGGTLTYIDHVAGRRWSVDALDATLKSPDWTGPAALAVTGMLNGEEVEINATAGVFSALLEGRVTPMSLALRMGAAPLHLKFEGRMGADPLAVDGRVEADSGDVAALGRALGGTAINLPSGFGKNLLAVKGALTMTAKGDAYLRDATLQMDGNSLTGDLDWVPGEARPKLTARLTGGPLDLSQSDADTATTAEGGPRSGWSDAPIDVSSLATLDADLSITAPALKFGALAFGPTRMRITLDRLRAVFSLAEMEAYGGTVGGQFVVNGRGGLSVGGDLALRNITLAPFLSALAGYDRLSGTGDLAVRFLGVGSSMAAIMTSLSGSGDLALRDGEVRGVDVQAMLRALDAGYVGTGQKTLFDSVTGSFTIDAGVLRNSDMKLTGPALTATGAGPVDIGGRRIDYRLRPTALTQSDGSGGVMVPLLITGPWEDPKFRLDLESIARERMEAEARALEDRTRAEAERLEAEAKAELERRLQDDLGVEALPGEDIEDAARRRLDEAIEDEAGRLLEDLLGSPPGE